MNEEHVRFRNKIESTRVAASWYGMTLRQYARVVVRLMKQAGMRIPREGSSYEEHELELPPHLCGNCRHTGGTFDDSSVVLAAERNRFKVERKQTDDLIAAFGPLVDFLESMPEMPKLTALLESLNAPFEAIMASREAGKTGSSVTTKDPR